MAVVMAMNQGREMWGRKLTGSFWPQIVNSGLFSQLEYRRGDPKVKVRDRALLTLGVGSFR